ncbi:MAG: mechanosensitive ion channel family protein [Gammaproteobacteria bacterium]|nr:mechanosensitive ion channel family protein [Gammaproteobacteria bacterium]MBU2477607.1 mechanosensitive ion channel family protein [Gammaproteobacteria bacterium]
MELMQEYFSSVAWQDIIFSALRILLILTLGWLASIITRTALRRFEHRLIEQGRQQGDIASEATKRAETLVRLLRQGVAIMIWLVAILVLLNELGISVGPILASAGVAGLAVGFGAQNLVRDVISGFFLILENQVRIGDVAVVNGTGGLVEAINFRTLILRDLSGTVHVFPNGSVTTLANLTKEWSAYVFEIGVAYKENTDQVIEIMRSVADELQEDPQFGRLIVDKIEIFGVDKLADSAVVIKGRIKTQPIKQWDVGREFLRRIKLAFDQQGIEIPFPQRSLSFSESGAASLARLFETGTAPQ